MGSGEIEAGASTISAPASGPRDLFVHIGAPKTGTTALQRYLHDSRDVLLQHGVLYPRGGVLKNAHHILGAAVFPSRSSRLAGVGRAEALDASLEAIQAEIAETNPRAVVLSTEYLWGYLSKTNILRMLAPFAGWRIHLVLYVRRQDELAQSLYVQAVKGGEQRSFAEWLAGAAESDKAGFHFDRVIQGWMDCGMDIDVIVRVYEKGQLDPDIRRDFLDVIAPGASIELPRVRIANSSPDVTTIELLRAVSAGVEDKELANGLRRRLIAASPPRTLFEPLTYFGPGEAAAFVERFAEGNATLARSCLNRDDGVLFQLAPKDSDEPRAWPGVGEVLMRLVSMLPEIVDPEAPAKAKAKRKAKKARVHRELPGDGA